jgi:Protein of unknown function (DUF4236)
MKMGVRFRKSFKVAPGVRMNVGKKGISTSIGGKSLRVNSSSRGISVGASLPGTGISYNKHLSSRNKRPQRTNYESIREQNINQAQLEVNRYESHIEMLTSVHQEVNNSINWNEIVQSTPPFVLGQDGPNYQNAILAIENYKPTLRDKLFNRIEARKRILQEDLETHREKDQKLYNDWKENVQEAKNILNGERNSWDEVIQKINPFEDIDQLGSSIQYSFPPTEPTVIVTIDIKNKRVIPNNILSITKTGKLSKKNMPKGKYYQLYQDYVCSCVLRIAREFFAILPVNEIIIHVYDEITAEESNEYGCILSTKINSDELIDINFTEIDCSDTIETFTHNMKMLKTKGFKKVEEVL